MYMSYTQIFYTSLVSVSCTKMTQKGPKHVDHNCMRWYKEQNGVQVHFVGLVNTVFRHFVITACGRPSRNSCRILKD